MTFLFLCLAFWLLCGLLTAVAASGKGRNGCGWGCLGMFLGPFGIILALVVGRPAGTLRKCPSCAEIVQVETPPA
jgi:hypothetical protein